ncbi:hypothetical protein FH972_024075 [Carpinus fangiana]|uniref:Myb-like domain-containing protein n=1 Tax=Carpinus fangiana TaxID=176857 RepID=A0A5N6KXS8_9ROSI|nr:hypothetical protein FH972_024075 [Carpinus fangiana]
MMTQYSTFSVATKPPVQFVHCSPPVQRYLEPSASTQSTNTQHHFGDEVPASPHSGSVQDPYEDGSCESRAPEALGDNRQFSESGAASDHADRCAAFQNPAVTQIIRDAITIVALSPLPPASPTEEGPPSQPPPPSSHNRCPTPARPLLISCSEDEDDQVAEDAGGADDLEYSDFDPHQSVAESVYTSALEAEEDVRMPHRTLQSLRCRDTHHTTPSRQGGRFFRTLAERGRNTSRVELARYSDSRMPSRSQITCKEMDSRKRPAEGECDEWRHGQLLRWSSGSPNKKFAGKAATPQIESNDTQSQGFQGTMYRTRFGPDDMFTIEISAQELMDFLTVRSTPQAGSAQSTPTHGASLRSSSLDGGSWGRPYTASENALLRKLKKKGLSWGKISKRFPGRSKAALQVHYSTKLQHN